MNEGAVNCLINKKNPKFNCR